MTFVRKYIMPLIITTILYVICMIHLGFKALLNPVVIPLYLISLIIRLMDDLFDYEKDLKEGKVIFKRTTILLIMISLVLLTLLYSIVFTDFIVLVFVLLIICILYYAQKLPLLKILILPLIILYLYLHTSFGIYPYIMLGVSIVLSIGYYLLKNKKQGK